MCFIDQISEFILSLIPVGLGTFAGAAAAYTLEKNERKKAVIRNRVSEGNMATLVLFQYWSDIRQFYKEHIKDLPNKETAWLDMRATFPRNASPLRVNASSLSFLFEGKDKNLLAEILLEETRYDMLIAMINRRSSVMLEKVHPAIESMASKGEDLNNKNIEEHLGPSTAALIKTLSNSIIGHTKENLNSLSSTREKLRVQLEEMFPNEEIIKVKEVEI